MIVKRDRVDQARTNMMKVARTAIRLRHMVEADNEVNERLPGLVAEFDAAVQRGELPDPISILEAYDA